MLVTTHSFYTHTPDILILKNNNTNAKRKFNSNCENVSPLASFLPSNKQTNKKNTHKLLLYPSCVHFLNDHSTEKLDVCVCSFCRFNWIFNTFFFPNSVETISKDNKKEISFSLWNEKFKTQTHQKKYHSKFIHTYTTHTHDVHTNITNEKKTKQIRENIDKTVHKNKSKI